MSIAQHLQPRVAGPARCAFARAVAGLTDPDDIALTDTTPSDRLAVAMAANGTPGGSAGTIRAHRRGVCSCATQETTA